MTTLPAGREWTARARMGEGGMTREASRGGGPRWQGQVETGRWIPTRLTGTAGGLDVGGDEERGVSKWV